MEGHKGPIFSLKWSRKGTLLLSGSADKTAVVWDAHTGKLRQQWDLHEGASPSAARQLYMAQLQATEPSSRAQSCGAAVHSM